MTRQSHFSGISGSTLKLIAVFSMLVDHTGATVLRTLCHLPSITAVPGRAGFFCVCLQSLAVHRADCVSDFLFSSGGRIPAHTKCRKICVPNAALCCGLRDSI